MDASTPSYLPANHREEYKKFLVKLDDYVIALTRPILSGELKMAKVDSIYDGALLNQRVGKLLTDENKDFVYCLLQTSQLISDIEKNIAGNDPPNLSSQQIGDIAVRIPKGNEQQKIVDCLTSIDELISNNAQKVDALKAHKEGLMQQLFPAVDEAG
jgi:type I restriction enzyme S subunit